MKNKENIEDLDYCNCNGKRVTGVFKDRWNTPFSISTAYQ